MSNLVFNLIAFIILIFLDNNIIKRSKNLKKEKSIKNIEKKWDDITDFIFVGKEFEELSHEVRYENSLQKYKK